MTPMHRFLIVAALFTAFASGGCTGTKPDEPEDEQKTIDVWKAETDVSARIALLLKPREVPAEILLTVLPDDIQQIGDKLKQAAESNPATFLQLMRDGARKGPPPYDARLGITQEEYELLTVGSHLQLQKKSDVVLKITKTPDERLLLTGLPDMKELFFVPSVQAVVTPYGELIRPSLFEANATRQTTGPLQGYAWRSTTFDDALARFQIPEIVLAQSPTGDAWLKLTVIDTFDNRRVVDYFVRFAGPTK